MDRTVRSCSLSLLALLVLASPATALVEIGWVAVGDPGAPCDPQPSGCFGFVPDAYRISTFEITAGQYAEFLNAKAASDPLGLWHPDMDLTVLGVTRSGADGSYAYAAPVPDAPAIGVFFFSALRFANWMHNGQGDGDTETGAYTLLGGTPVPSNGDTVTRNPGAQVFIPSEDEWYKAAYHALATVYTEYPTQSNDAPLCTGPVAAPNAANCASGLGFPTAVGSYPGSPSAKGTFDQGGNVMEWTETAEGVDRVARGGTYLSPVGLLHADAHGAFDPMILAPVGIRLAAPAEPPSAVSILRVDQLGQVFGYDSADDLVAGSPSQSWPAAPDLADDRGFFAQGSFLYAVTEAGEVVRYGTIGDFASQTNGVSLGTRPELAGDRGYVSALLAATVPSIRRHLQAVLVLVLLAAGVLVQRSR